MEPKDWIDVTTEKNHYSLDHFVIPKHYEKDVSSILIPHGVIMVGAFIFLISHTFAGKSNTVRQDRIHKLARLIVDDTTGPLGKAISYLISLTWKLKMSMIKKKKLYAASSRVVTSILPILLTRSRHSPRAMD